MAKKLTTNDARSTAAKAASQALAKGAQELKADVQKTVRKRGKPQPFTREKWEDILTEIATYGDLIEICQRADMPSNATVYKWMRQMPELWDEMREAWAAFSMIGHSVNNNILRGGCLSTGDFRRDEALAAQNRWFMSKTNRRDFGDKTQLDIIQHEPVILPIYAIATDGDDGV